MIRKDTSTSPNQSRQPESNRRHTGYKSVVLPTELCRHVRFILYVKERDLIKKHRISFLFSQGSDRRCYLLSGSDPDSRRIRDSNPGTVSRLSVFKTDPFNRLGNPAYYFTICQPCVKLTGKYNHPKTDPKDFVKLSSFSFVPSSLFKLNFEF